MLLSATVKPLDLVILDEKMRHSHDVRIHTLPMMFVVTDILFMKHGFYRLKCGMEEMEVHTPPPPIFVRFCLPVIET